ncbi:MAG: hypothetical protein ACLFU8_17470 [Anaerolineales bacterium]
MATVDVTCTEKGKAYSCEVEVREGGGSTHHTVTVEQEDYERLAGGEASVEALVAESFRFLLEREPKESILRRFELTVINRYFPEYERKIRGRL